MAVPPVDGPRLVSVGFRGQYYVQDPLEFVTLSPAEGRVAARLLFSPKPGTTLEIPLTAKAMSDLVRTLVQLHGKLPEEMNEEIEKLASEGKLPTVGS